MDEFAALIGIDWADSKHDLCLLDCSTSSKEFSILKHTPEAIDEWAAGLSARSHDRKIALCLEQSRPPFDLRAAQV